ncbi:MAG: glycosyltransferase family 9 protein, partial [Candidatus Woesearchaeota archaeon]
MIKEYQIRDILKRNAIIFHWFDKITLWLLGKPYGSLENHRKDKKILIIRNDHIGDLAQDTGIFREIKRAYPNYKITALVSEEAKPLIEKNYNVDKIIICNLFWRKWWSYKVWKNYFKVLKEIKEEEFDIGIDLRGSFLNIYFFLWKPKIKERIGYYNIGG